MKRYLLTLLYIACSVYAMAQADPDYPAPPSAPQNIVAAEYYIDTDPGYGNATAIALTPGVNIVNTAFNASTAGLSNGVHRIFIRTRNNEGRWSFVVIRDFLVDFDPTYPAAMPAPQNLVAAEYFIDTDPGIGNGTAIAFAPGVDLNNIAAAINVTGLSVGTHRIYIRSKSNEGRWSITHIKDFIIDFDYSYIAPPPAPQNIITAEYFFDTDPGFGNGTSISITPGLDLSNISFNANTAGLSNGTHRLYIRTKNNEGRWAIVNIRDFIVDLDSGYPPAPPVPQNIIAAEYFINTDPGPGNGTPIAITPATDINNLAVVVNTAGLSASSTNQLYIRTKNAEGNWSITNISTFVISIVSDPIYETPPAVPQNIIAAEYFINTDPGAGNGTPITITPATNISNLAVVVNTTGLPAFSTNQLYIRTKNAEGKWSITNISTFVVDIVGDPIYQAPPAAPQNIVNAEYFIDTDPGTGNGAPIAINPGTDISNINFPINIAALAVGEHRFYLRSLSVEGKWSITNSRTFNIGTLTVLPDSITFLNTIVNTSSTRSLIVRNNSASTQSITAVTTAAPFGSNFTNTRNIAAGATDTTLVSFTPTAAIQYQGVINLQTSGGSYAIPLKGTGISVLNSWVLEPATGHDYGTAAIGSTNNFNFTIRNNGNTTITLTEVVSSNPAFVPSYTVGTTIAAGASISLPVSFNPSAVLSYNAILKIKASAGGPDSVTTIINGIGYSPATPPTLTFVSTIPYDGQRGVNPAAGQTGNYTYKIVYRSADNRPPANNFPQVGIDRNGDQDFDDINEGLYPMTKEGTSTNYVSGVTYTYTDNYFQYSNTMGYRFSAKDSLGNSATSINTAYYAGPIITYEVLDLKLFANDISFSKSNPLPGESFTLTANITNNSAFSATNVPVYFYRDTILIGSTVLPTVNAFSSTSITRILSFGADGFFPIKVWIDPGNTLNENNILNNYAIRPIIVGSPVLPGGITVAGSTSLQNCPTQKLIFTGHADYFGTSIPTSVAGAEVTINTGSAILKTTTDANGNYNLVMENPPCGGTLTYTVSVTDFTFTSSLFTGAQAISCPAPNACMPPPNFTGGITVGILTTPCSNIVGGSSQATLTIKYRERNIANMWSAWDKIWKDTVKVFNNGVLIQTYYTNDVPDFGSVGTFPGDVKVIPVNIPLGSTGPNNITVVATYVYNEFLQIPTSIHHGSFTQMTATAGSTIIAEPNKPNLSLGNFIQTSYRSFTFQDNNTECAAAGSHLVRIVDVTVPGSPVTVQTNTVTGVAGKSHATLSANFPSLLPGVYQFRIITDTTELVDETDETNNAVLVTLTVPEPDLTISKISSSPTDLPQNASVSFKATINNSGVAAGPFTVRFLANGVPIGGDIPVSSIIEKGELTVTSNIFTVPTAEIDCPINITVIVDAGSMINESNESNNSATIPLGSDIVPLQLQGESGSSSNPERVRVNTSKHFNAYIRNTGSRDIHNVTVKFMHKGIKIGEALVPLIKAGIGFPAVASFTHTFTNPGKDTVEVFTDTANLVCEIDDNNNTGLYHIVVTDSKEDFVVLSQYISPSSLNPNANQNISIVGTVKNIGNKVSPQSNMRFYVDNIQLGSAVPFNSLQIGQDTTVAATVTYSSQIAGIKVIKITVDEETLVSEEDENNNLATRTIIVGDAPDMTRSITQPISFNPNGFNAGDSVTIAYQLRNNGTNGGTAWVRFKVFDAAGSLTAIDSVAFTLAPGSNTTLSRRMHFVIDSGFVVTEIVNCTPFESNLLNNSDTLYFSTVAKMKTNLIVNNLDMKAGAPQQLPGWIGGKIVLGDYDLIVNGNIVNFDTAHFVVTNGSGKLKIINGNAQNIFPVGANLYRTNFAKINNIGTTDNFSVRVLPYVLRNGTSGDTIRTSNVNRTWMIDEDIAGGSNGTVEMFWNASDELPGFDRTASRTAHFISNWQLSGPGNALVDTNGIFSRAQAGYTSFSPFTVTSGTTVLIPLRFIEFTAVPNGKDVLLKWITEAEQNTSHFDVEFSTDGAGFTAIGKVNSANTGGQHRYEFTHQSPIGNTLYYRIRQVDLDGRYTYSKVVRVNVVTATNITLSPNPARNFIQLHNVDRNELREIRIVGMDGKLIQMNSNNSQMLIDIQQLKNGYYVLQVIKKDGSTVNLSFVKQ